ncbi:MAG: Glycosyl transferase family 2 [Candidatus Woesebacteria bacterium GW2011_GWB1_44_11]|uniref:dolichyl-phosphate beta-glucosyltransferase n=1 Tax=Candidatus Woesebacteria bacterium GW2011_GWB1_44_11 TaxID=1618579 RepID=A0A837I6M7_9BACT|nr:MAG: Glycosyl transferase family 2 [Candidatus Woesebacteria bacterium GW2011_GWB1_44_11]
MKTYLSVVIPAFNEAYNLRTGVLDSVYDYLNRQKFTWEILFVDDGSTDNTAKLAEEFAKKHQNFFVLKEPHRGKAGTVTAGILKAKGEIILFTDADQATPIDQLEKILPKFKEGFDVVIGSRHGREGAPIVRKIMAFGFSLLRLIVLRLPFKDTQCGFKAFSSNAADKIFKRLEIFSSKNTSKGASVTAGFDLEILYIARKLGYKVAEVPVDWHHKEGTKVDPIKDSIEGLRGLLLVRINALQGKYNV